uniref:Origin recognition complex subunit 2 n=1 Tax=Anopheles atroparvus TaxID=41427 RepID=A0AAG5DMJ9_ANOAO
MSSHDRGDAAEVENSSSDIEEAQLQVEQTINQQSAYMYVCESPSSATSTVKSTQRALRVRKECHRSNHTDESDVANDDRQYLEPEEKYDPAVKLLDSIVDLSLFDQRSDVAGGHVFGFHTPKKRDSMVTLAQESAERTPKTRQTILTTPKRLIGRRSKTLTAGAGGIPKTPKSPTGAKPKSSIDAATPIHASNDEIKKKWVVECDDKYYMGGFSANESDVSTDDSEEEESFSEDGDDADDDTEPDVSDMRARSKSSGRKSGLGKSTGHAIDPGLPARTGKAVQSDTNTGLGHYTDAAEKPAPEYFLKSDEYFSSHASGKATTSDKTLDHLETPRLEQDKIDQLLAERSQPDPHTFNIKQMLVKYEQEFPLWLVILHQGFNVMLHGMGSKRVLLDSFHRKHLFKNDVVILQGFFPELSVKDVLDAIANDILHLTLATANTHEAIDTIERKLRRSPDKHLFLLVHNLDGEPMRNERMQMVLCRLATIPNVHIVATIDSISAPLMWDTSQLSLYNFSWRNVTTLLPYATETAFETSLLVKNSGSLTFSSMCNVFASLTSNARGIFMAIVRHQLANGGPNNPNYNGMLLKDLYRISREAFLVSNDVALRAHLTEFIDHKMLRLKRTSDGAENLLIPFEYGLLQRFDEKASDK